MTKRGDKKKNIAKVAKALMEDPTLTEREIVAKVGVGKGTVHRAKKTLDQSGAKDDRIVGLTDGDFQLQQLIQAEKFRRLQQAEKISNKDLDTRDVSSARRYTLFRGSATDAQGGLNVIVKSYAETIEEEEEE